MTSNDAKSCTNTLYNIFFPANLQTKRERKRPKYRLEREISRRFLYRSRKLLLQRGNPGSIERAPVAPCSNNSKLQPQTRYTRIVTCPSHCRLHPPVSIAWSWFVGVLGSARLATPHCTSIGRCPGKAGERQEKKIGQFREIVKRGFYEEGR